jgi:hypothetical protein
MPLKKRNAWFESTRGRSKSLYGKCFAERKVLVKKNRR